MKTSTKTPHVNAGQVDAGFMQFPMFNFDALIEMQRPYFSAVAEFNAKLVEGMTSYNDEVVGFVNKRLNEDLAITKQLGDCKTAQDVYGVCNEFYQTALKQYQGEAEKMSEIGKTIADETAHNMQDQLDEIGRQSKAA